MSMTWRGLMTRGAVLVAVSGVLAACDVNIGVDASGATVHQTKRFTVTGVPDVTLKTFDGPIEIRAWDRPEVFVDIEKRAADQAALDRIEIVAEQSGNTVTIEARHESQSRNIVNIGFHISPSVRLVASVPREANLVVSSGDGTIGIERVSGRLEIHTGDGRITGHDLAGDVRVQTGDGAVTLDGVSGRADIETSDGGVKLSGRLEVLTLRTGDGSVWVTADDGSTMAGTWEIRTGDGGVSLELPVAFDADLDADTGDGRVRLDNIDLPGSSSRQSVKGAIGAGGRTLRIRTNDGTITVKRRG